MLVCENCFSDAEIKAQIRTNGFQGNCDTCSSQNVSMVSNEGVSSFLVEILSCFKRDEVNGKPLLNLMMGDLSFFLSSDVGTAILVSFLEDYNSEIFNPLDSVVYEDEIIQCYSYWDDLKNQLKTELRFIQNIEYLTDELDWDACFSNQFRITKEDILYRGRVHHQERDLPFKSNEMKCPSPKVSTVGRANSKGIPSLYLADNVDTVLYEVRGTFLDEISVGKFTVSDEKKSLQIVDFNDRKEYSLFQLGKISTAVKAKLLRARISKELSKPMKRYDSDVEYIPTQFICEFIKVFTGADGIRFSSSLHPKGNNFVIFNDKHMECYNVEIRKVTRLKIDHRRG